MTGARRAAVLAVLAGLASGAAEAGAGDEALIARWSQTLRRLDVDPAPLMRAPIRWADDAEAGVLPDGSLQLPSAWRDDDPYAPAVIGRVAHLTRHLALGLPEPASVGSCATWQLLMLVAELDGLATESRVRHALGAPWSGDAMALELQARIAHYRARCG